MKLKILFVSALSIALIGCANLTQRSELNLGDAEWVAENCFPNGKCPVVIRNMNGAVVMGKQMIDTFTALCYQKDGLTVCDSAKHEGYIGDGTAESTLRGSIVGYYGDDDLFGNEERNVSVDTSSSGEAPNFNVQQFQIQGQKQKMKGKKNYGGDK